MISCIPGEAFAIRVPGSGPVRLAYAPEAESTKSVNRRAFATRLRGNSVNAILRLGRGPNAVPDNMRHLPLRGGC